MPQAGFEPAPARFLRPPPLPLGYCGHLFRRACTQRRRRICTSAHPQCSEQDSNLHQRDSHSRASAGWATGAFVQWTAEGIEPSLSGCRPEVFPLDDGPHVFSVARRIRTFILELRRLVLIRLSYRNKVSSMIQAGFEPALSWF